MIDIKGLSTEIKSSVVFGVGALFISFLFGIIFGIGIGTVLLRTLILAIMFAGLGFAVITVLKRFVPEVYEMFNRPGGIRASDNSSATSDDSIESVTVDVGTGSLDADNDDIPDGSDIGNTAPKKDEDSEFSELSKDDFPILDKVPDYDADGQKKKLGKHIISDEKIVTYEPKILAQAIRTMMSRDED